MINLLPTEYKKVLANEYKERVILVSLYGLLCALLLTLFALLPAYITAKVHVDELASELTVITKTATTDENSSVAAIAADVNAKLAKYDEIKNAVKIAPLVTQFLDNPTAGITLEQFQFDSSNMTLTLNGAAKTRDALLAFQTKLQQFPNVITVNIPISSFVKQKDVSFTVTITLTPSGK